jgi:aspartate/tyrosine/aromatic aminotransferase
MEMIVEEVDNDEYLLQKAETELREAQERVNQLRQKLAQKAPNTSTQ